MIDVSGDPLKFMPKALSCSTLGLTRTSVTSQDSGVHSWPWSGPAPPHTWSSYRMGHGQLQSLRLDAHSHATVNARGSGTALLWPLLK